MSLKLNSSGGGSITLQEPVTASNLTLEVPALAGTLIAANSSGRVGIGTTPASILHTLETVNNTTVMSGLYLQNFSSTNNSQAGIGLWSYDNFNSKIYTLRSGTSQGNIVFATNGGGGTGESNVFERMRLTHDNRLLLGTTATVNSARLTIADSTGNPAMGFSTYLGNNNNTINTIAINQGGGGGLCIISGVDFQSGGSFSRIFAIAARVSGGTSSFTNLIGSSNTGAASFSFAESGGFLTVTASGFTGFGGSWSVMFINC
jgi:hypothetical protein